MSRGPSVCTTASSCVGFNDSSSTGKKIIPAGTVLSRPEDADPFLVKAHFQPPNQSMSTMIEARLLVVLVERPVSCHAIEPKMLSARGSPPVLRPPEERTAQPLAGEVAPDRQAVDVTSGPGHVAPGLLVGPQKRDGPDGLSVQPGKVHLP